MEAGREQLARPGQGAHRGQGGAREGSADDQGAEPPAADLFRIRQGGHPGRVRREGAQDPRRHEGPQERAPAPRGPHRQRAAHRRRLDPVRRQRGPVARARRRGGRVLPEGAQSPARVGHLRRHGRARAGRLQRDRSRACQEPPHGGGGLVRRDRREARHQAAGGAGEHQAREGLPHRADVQDQLQGGPRPPHAREEPDPAVPLRGRQHDGAAGVSAEAAAGAQRPWRQAQRGGPVHRLHRQHAAHRARRAHLRQPGRHLEGTRPAPGARAAGCAQAAGQRHRQRRQGRDQPGRVERHGQWPGGQPAHRGRVLVRRCIEGALARAAAVSRGRRRRDGHARLRVAQYHHQAGHLRKRQAGAAAQLRARISRR